MYLYPKLQDTSYRKVPKFSDTRKLCCNLSKIQTKRPNLRVFRQKDANGIANSEDPDQTAQSDLGLDQSVRKLRIITVASMDVQAGCLLFFWGGFGCFASMVNS